jgi:enoyl-CoA hydratase
VSGKVAGELDRARVDRWLRVGKTGWAGSAPLIQEKPMGDYENLNLKVHDYIATITLDRPPVNAISRGLYLDIAAVFGELAERTDDVRAAILTGAGRCFCAGRDLSNAEAEQIPWETRAKAARAAYQAIYHSVVPVIAAVNGPAIGAGFVISILCDFILASEKADFCMREIDVGLNMSVAALLRIFSQHQARRLAFTGEHVSPAEMHRLGAVSAVLAADDLMPEANRVAAVLAAKSPMALRAAKWSANEVELLVNDFEFAYRAIESRASLALFRTEDAKEAGRAFKEKRAPVFKNR